MGKVHLITAADLNDSAIGTSCSIDLRAVQEAVREAASHAGMTFNVTELSRESFAAEHITVAIRDLAPGSDDTVVFYYSGHGARAESKPDAWPVISLGSSAPPFDSFDLGWIYQALHKKRARMLLMFVDCCQTLVPDDKLNECGPSAILGLTEIRSTTNYRLLFQMFEGEVLMMSCKPGQTSGCDWMKGGFFTATLLEALRTSARSTRAATWETIAKQGSVPPRAKQEPIWKVIHAARSNIVEAPGMEPFPGDWNLGLVEEGGDVPALAIRSLPSEGRRCGSCGAWLADEDRFCSACGVPSRVTGNASGSSASAVISEKSPSPGTPLSQAGSTTQKAEQNPAPGDSAQRVLDEARQRSENVFAGLQRTTGARLEKLLEKLEDLDKDRKR